MQVVNLDSGVRITLDEGDELTPAQIHRRTSLSPQTPAAATPPAGEMPAIALCSPLPAMQPSSGPASRQTVSSSHSSPAPSPLVPPSQLPPSRPPPCFSTKDPAVQLCLAYDEQVRRAMWAVAATPPSILPPQLRSLVEREETTRAQGFQTALLERQLPPYAALLGIISDNVQRVVAQAAARDRIKPQRLVSLTAYIEALREHRVIALAAFPLPAGPPVTATRSRASSAPLAPSLGSAHSRSASGDGTGGDGSRAITYTPPSVSLPASALLDAKGLQISARISRVSDDDASASEDGDPSDSSKSSSPVDGPSGGSATRGPHPPPHHPSCGSSRDVGSPSLGAGQERWASRRARSTADVSGAEADVSADDVDNLDIGDPTSRVRAEADDGGTSASGLASDGTLQADSFNLPWALDAPGAEEPSQEVHAVDEPPPGLFRVRGSEYLTDRVKVPAGFRALQLLGVDLIRSDEMLSRVGEGRGRAKRERLRAAHGDDIFLVNFQLPGKPGHLSLLMWLGLTPQGRSDAKFYPLWRSFWEAEEDSFRDQRLKMMVIIPDGPFLLRKAVPGNKPFILGKGIHIDWSRGDGYLEADIDIASSPSAEKMWGLVQAVAKSIVVDLALIVEAKEVSQLPERLLSAVRIMKVNLAEL